MFSGIEPFFVDCGSGSFESLCSFSNLFLLVHIVLIWLGKYTAILAILVVGSFIIPMAQYFWYVRDDDSSDRFFKQDVPEPDPPKKKGFW